MSRSSVTLASIVFSFAAMISDAQETPDPLVKMPPEAAQNAIKKEFGPNFRSMETEHFKVISDTRRRRPSSPDPTPHRSGLRHPPQRGQVAACSTLSTRESVHGGSAASGARPGRGASYRGGGSVRTMLTAPARTESSSAPGWDQEVTRPSLKTGAIAVSLTLAPS